MTLIDQWKKKRFGSTHFLIKTIGTNSPLHLRMLSLTDIILNSRWKNFKITIKLLSGCFSIFEIYHQQIWINVDEFVQIISLCTLHPENLRAYIETALRRSDTAINSSLWGKYKASPVYPISNNYKEQKYNRNLKTIPHRNSVVYETPCKTRCRWGSFTIHIFTYAQIAQTWNRRVSSKVEMGMGIIKYYQKKNLRFYTLPTETG